MRSNSGRIRTFDQLCPGKPLVAERTVASAYA